MSYISIKNYAQLSKLEHDDIIKMMIQGINFLDGGIITFVSQVKSVEQEIMHNSESLAKLREPFNEDTFTLTGEGSIIEVNSKEVPPSLFFIMPDWEEKLSNHKGYVNDAFVLKINHLPLSFLIVDFLCGQNHHSLFL